MATITLTASGRGHSYSCSDGGGRADASTSSILYIGGNLYCTCIPFTNIPTALGSTGAGKIKIKSASLELFSVAAYNSSTGNTTTNALKKGIGNQGNSVDALVQSSANIYGSSSVWGPRKANSYFSSSTEVLTTSDRILDFTEQVQAICNNLNMNGGIVDFHTGTSYIWICANSITSQTKKYCLRAGNNSGYRAQLTIEYYTSNVRYWDGSNWNLVQPKYWDGSNWITCSAKYWDGSNWIQC